MKENVKSATIGFQIRPPFSFNTKKKSPLFFVHNVTKNCVLLLIKSKTVTAVRFRGFYSNQQV